MIAGGAVVPSLVDINDGEAHVCAVAAKPGPEATGLLEIRCDGLDLHHMELSGTDSQFHVFVVGDDQTHFRLLGRLARHGYLPPVNNLWRSEEHTSELQSQSNL